MNEFSIKDFLHKYVLRYIREIDRKHSPTVFIPAALFSFFMVFGYSFEKNGNWSLIFGSGIGQLIKACIKFSVFFIIFYYAICYLYSKFNAASFSDTRNGTVISEKKEKHLSGIYGKYINCLSRFPFRTAFLTLAIIYIPYVIISYPAVFMGDTLSQIVQTYPQLGIIRPAYLRGHLLSDQIYLNNHHPIAHTLLIHTFLQIGAAVFHSFNVGIFLFALFQFFFLLSGVSYGIKILVQKTAMPDKYIPLIILYYIISPRIQSYMFLLTKDVTYAIILLYFLLFLYSIIKTPARRYYILFALSGLGMILFRNEAKYILIISLPVLALLCRKLRKFFMGYWIAVIAFGIIFFHLLLPICNVNPSSVAEMLSVPFQQTARYIKEHETEVTGEEREAIDAVLNYSVLAINYSPYLSDSVKVTYNEDCTKDDLLRYFKVWFQMFLKHPGTYIQATMHNYYYYFYPGLMRFYDFSYANSSYFMEVINKNMEPLGTDFHYPSRFDRARELYTTVRENYIFIPPFILLMLPAVYAWVLILLLFYGIYRKSPQALSILLVPLVLLCICLLGPCNGFYGRYLYPILLVLPIMTPLYFALKK